jgi:glutamate formiminotransferase
MSDTEAAKDTNWAVRENTNDITRTVTEIVRVNASGILRGVKTVDERIVDRQTVQVTIRWDRDSEATSQFFNKKFTSSK